MANRYQTYLEMLQKPFRKITKLEFLQPDNSVGYTLDGNYSKRYRTTRDTRAFIQSGNLNVSLQNGQRRKANITLANIDDAFAYAVNKIWYGDRIRLSMGLILPDETEFYLPQGVFYASKPSHSVSPNSDTVTYNLVDKWSMLDGTLGGNLASALSIPSISNGRVTNIFEAMLSLLRVSKYDYEATHILENMIDSVPPIFTEYFNDKFYNTADGGKWAMTDLPYDIILSEGDNTIAQAILELNTIIAGLIGYDQTGALRIEPSEDNISDDAKPILWDFSTGKSQLFSMTHAPMDTDVRNDILVVGEGLDDGEVWARASNYDASSNTNINLIGKRTMRESNAAYWNADQCAGLASFYLKQKTALKQNVSVQCQQMFHLYEGGLISIARPDKDGCPVEKHVIQSYTLPLAETGAMTINACSIADYPQITLTKST